MLSSRLYLGMLPVAGLLIGLCLYSVFAYNSIGRHLREIQRVHYAAIFETERLLISVTQLERGLRLKQSGDHESGDALVRGCQEVIEDWLKRTEDPAISEYEGGLRSLILQLSDSSMAALKNGAKLVIDSELIDEIGAAALEAVANRNERIREINQRFRAQSEQHYYIMLIGIIASVVLMAIIAYLLSQRILKPIDALTEAASHVGAGNWDFEYTPNNKDEIGRLEWSFVEMTERLRHYQQTMNREIVRIRRRMEQCFNNFPHPVLFIDSESHIIYANPPANELFETLETIDDLPEPIRSQAQSIFGTGEALIPTEFEETITLQVDSEARHFLPLLIRIDSEEMDEIECGLILQDVTHLRLSDELKSDLVATVSHEIKTPVTSANMALHLLSEQSVGQINPEQEELVRTAISDLKRLQSLLGQMLQIARLERRKPDVDTKLCSPESLVESAVELQSTLAEGRGISLKTEVQSGLPQIEVDPKMIEIVLSNFVSNAVKYSEAGSAVTLYAQLENGDGRRVRIGVLDEGQGISVEDKEKVFDKFYRSEDAKKVDGIGLGLSISKDIIQAHEGRISCEPRPKKGSDFYFELPPATGAS